MAGKRAGSNRALHRLTVREVQCAGDGDHADGGGLVLRVRGESASWLFRFTSPAGRRREMGLGRAHRGSARQAGDSLTGARDLAHSAREQLRRGVDPIDAREASAAAAKRAEQENKAAAQRQRWTLARAARDYHERVIEPTRTPKHAAQWISSLENHVPATLGAGSHSLFLQDVAVTGPTRAYLRALLCSSVSTATRSVSVGTVA